MGAGCFRPLNGLVYLDNVIRGCFVGLRKIRFTKITFCGSPGVLDPWILPWNNSRFSWLMTLMISWWSVLNIVTKDWRLLAFLTSKESTNNFVLCILQAVVEVAPWKVFDEVASFRRVCRGYGGVRQCCCYWYVAYSGDVVSWRQTSWVPPAWVPSSTDPSEELKPCKNDSSLVKMAVSKMRLPKDAAADEIKMCVRWVSLVFFWLLFRGSLILVPGDVTGVNESQGRMCFELILVFIPVDLWFYHFDNLSNNIL